MKYYIYWKTGEHEVSGTEYRLLKRAVKQHVAENPGCMPEPELLQNFVIEKTSKGKPYLAGSDIHFSVSHTDGLWVCAIGPAPCGLDVQAFGDYRESQVAKRMFAEPDAEYAKANGSEGFYRIWSRFEAVSKYDGSGIFANRPSLSDGRSVFDEIVTEKGKKVFLREFCERDFEMEMRLAGAICTDEQAEIIFRRLNG